MKTNWKKLTGLALIAAGTLTFAAPAYAEPDQRPAKKYREVSRTMPIRDDGQRYGERQNTKRQNWRGNRQNDREFRNQRRGQRHNMRGSGYRVPPSWRAVRGKIIRVGRGRNEGCFRVKRKGRYQRERAIVTVRYCENYYGEPVKVRGSKRLVRYLQPVYYNW